MERFLLMPFRRAITAYVETVLCNPIIEHTYFIIDNNNNNNNNYYFYQKLKIISERRLEFKH
jgi:hypothetical protein